MRSDTEIQQAVLAELQWDPRVEETEVGGQVADGVVTLAGTVSSYVKRLAAQQAAHRVTGVRDVANDLVVQLPGTLAKTDTEIARDVRQALALDVALPEERILSTVANGWVTLEGSVDYAYQRDDAAWVVGRLVGVRGVLNRIAVEGPHCSAESLRETVELALLRRAEREANRIRVDVHGDTATLSGAVHSWAARRAVLGAARHTPGVAGVVDHLRVEYGI